MAAINGTDGGNVLGGGIDSDTIRGRRGGDRLTGGGGQDTFVIRRGDGTDIITDFGGVGTGVRPASEVIAEVDVLQFEGDGLTAENMLLTPEQTSEGPGGVEILRITFEGVEDTQVILEGFFLENLDNLQQATGASVDLGNILFNGQSEIQDSFDVFNSDQQRDRVFNPNTVTFLNSRANITQGREGSDDVINALGSNDVISGLSGNDLLRGGFFNDVLSGGGSTVGEIDTLTGGTEVDRFNLGNATDIFYDDGNLATAGTADYALITDFTTGEDVIRIFGQPGDYHLSASSSGLPVGTAIYLDKPSAEPDELIGIIQGSSDLSLDSDDFSFTSAELNLDELDGSNGFVINGIDKFDYSGRSVSTAGDINGDGFDDLIIGAPSVAPYGAGESYVVFSSGAGFDPSLDLSELDGSNGFVINGIDDFDDSGHSVSTVGDINGDGFDDLIIGAPSAAPNGQENAGESYVVFGIGEEFDANLDLAELNGSNGFVINGIQRGDSSGTSVSTAGDVNGDGFDDLLIGAPDLSRNGQFQVGGSYVVFGGGEVFAASFDLADLNGSNGFVLQGIDPYGLSGYSVSTAGDINGDGFDDLLIGTPFAKVNGQENAGESYVVFGSGEGFAASFDLADLNGSNGFVLQGIDEGDFSGSSVSTAGDVNGDGFDDLVVGAPAVSHDGQFQVGESYVVFGSGEGFAANFDLADLNGSNGFVLKGIAELGRSGSSVSSAGDVNGDGFDDLIVGAPAASPNGLGRAGESYVVFGSGEGFAANFDLADLNGSNGFVINGIHEGDLSGFSVSSAGDVNGDGFDDLLIGAPAASPNGQFEAGESYVVFGRDFTGQAVLNVELADGSSNFLADPLLLA